MENNIGESYRRSAQGRTHSDTRERILREVEHRDATTSEIVSATGLHENTVRGHLEALLADGYLDRRRTNPNGRGRPAWQWIAVAASNPAAPYAELSSTLAEAMASGGDDPIAAARKAGTRWGERLAAAARGAGAPSLTTAWEQVIAAMTRQGFSPGQPDGDSKALLRRCPLLAAATGNESIVCTVHEGMIEGVARRWAPGARAKLTPFAEPHACAVQLLGATPS